MMKANKGTSQLKKFYDSAIPDDWTTPEFGVVFKFLSSYAFSHEKLSQEKSKCGILNIHYGDIHSTFENEILDFEIENRIPYIRDGLVSEKVLIKQDFSFLLDGDLVIADASEDYDGLAESVELKNINGRKVLSGLHTLAARDMEGKTASGFRTYLLSNPAVKKVVKSVGQGISVYGISKKNLAKIRVPLPPLPEQKAIAELLSTWDEVIIKTQAVIAQKELAQKWLMQQLLTGKKRLPGQIDKWKIKPLKYFITQIVREIDKPLNPYLALGIRSHGKGTFLKPNELPEKNSMDKLFIVRKNDLIVNITFAWEMAIAIVELEGDGALVSHRFPTYTFNTGVAHSYFFRYFILQPKMKYMLDQISPGGAGRNRVLDKADFINLAFSVPEYDEQIEIAKVLLAADNEINLLKTKLEKLKEQKKGLMQKLLTGKIRLK